MSAILPIETLYHKHPDLQERDEDQDYFDKILGKDQDDHLPFDNQRLETRLISLDINNSILISNNITIRYEGCQQVVSLNQ